MVCINLQVGYGFGQERIMGSQPCQKGTSTCKLPIIYHADTTKKINKIMYQ